MILGLSMSAFTALHVIISLIGIASGLVVVGGMFSSDRLSGWSALFLASTLLTSITGFLFPISSFTPALGVGVFSTAVLIVAIVALYVFHLRGSWRWIYVGTAILALYLNVFVAVVQAFQKLPFLHALAPTLSESPFQAAQGVVLLLFVVLGFWAGFKFHPERRAMA